MLERFLGKDCRQKIEALESEVDGLVGENERLRKRLQKRNEKAEEDPAERQALFRALRKAETRIQGLEHELSLLKEARAGEAGDPFERILLSGSESLLLLDRISRFGECCTVRSFYIPQGGDGAGVVHPGEAARRFLESLKTDTGVFLTYDAGVPRLFAFAAVPPFPCTEEVPSSSPECIERFREVLAGQRNVLFVSAHAGSTFVGMASEEGLLAGRYVETEVKEKHSKGGWSQKRFERLREEDVQQHADRARAAFNELAREAGAIAEEIVLCGNLALAENIAQDQVRSGRRISYRRIDAKPGRDVGERIAKEIWSAVWYRIA
ncbi:peptide chain release factor [hydrocarbon metagenome]|uniref:Peptide chain release factor n=1 Tax=hydrocarbon metagenome TaxID=938273 RepID=A0A0W8FEN1_9ZZZZ|nr:Vms1/Ankzf1 family peptidyl-tRNA hydrolase [Methanomicrobiaceae archaeon]